MYLPVSDNVRLSEQNIMTNLVVTNLQATGVANELSNYSSLVGGVCPPTRREQFLVGAEGMAQQATQCLHDHPSGLPGPRPSQKFAGVFQKWLHLVKCSKDHCPPTPPSTKLSSRGDLRAVVYRASPRKSVDFCSMR